MEDRIKRGKERIGDKLNIPKELTLNVPKITVIGNTEITIENHKGILSFDYNQVKINSSMGIIKIQGEKFKILYIGGDTIILDGIFKGIIYEGVIS